VDEATVLREGFERPIDAPRLRDALRARAGTAGRVVILVDDGTRTTPVARILPGVFDELAAAGIGDDRVTFLTAPGTHREMTDAELRDKLGPFYGRGTIRQHRWLDEANLHDFGRTSDGTRVTANRLLAEAAFVLGVGSIVPHRVKGFSGGAKIAFPGVAGREIMEKNQWEASLRMSETVMGVADNPMRLRMEEAARLAGLHYIVNVVVAECDHKIVACVTGDVVAAHRAGCAVSREYNGARLPRRADIVISDAHPADRDVWQSAKGIYSGTMAVRRGGTLIVVAPNPEGVAKNHPNLLEIGYRPHQEVVRMVREGEVKDIVGVAILGDIAQILDHADCILVSPGVRREDAERLGFRWAPDAGEALAMGMLRCGREASVAVLRYGGHILPIVAHDDERLPERGAERGIGR
jgi:nickel-dependent lactate racemase